MSVKLAHLGCQVATPNRSPALESSLSGYGWMPIWALPTGAGSRRSMGVAYAHHMSKALADGARTARMFLDVEAGSALCYLHQNEIYLKVR